MGGATIPIQIRGRRAGATEVVGWRRGQRRGRRWLGAAAGEQNGSTKRKNRGRTGKKKEPVR